MITGSLAILVQSTKSSEECHVLSENKQTNERTKEQTNKQPNKQTNKQANLLHALNRG